MRPVPSAWITDGILSRADALDRAVSFCQKNLYDEPHYYSALTYFQLGQTAKAESRFEELLKLYPRGQYRDDQRAPQSLPECAAHVAHHMQLAPDRARHHRRGRREQSDAEQQHREIEIDPERRGGKRRRPKTPHHDHIGRGQRDLHEIGQHQRPAKREHRAKFIAPDFSRRDALGSYEKHDR